METGDELVIITMCHHHLSSLLLVTPSTLSVEPTCACGSPPARWDRRPRDRPTAPSPTCLAIMSWLLTVRGMRPRPSGWKWKVLPCSFTIQSKNHCYSSRLRCGFPFLAALGLVMSSLPPLEICRKMIAAGSLQPDIRGPDHFLPAREVGADLLRELPGACRRARCRAPCSARARWPSAAPRRSPDGAFR